jgi:peptidoglycan/LPS O-acetylase OafA/YrhL
MLCWMTAAPTMPTPAAVAPLQGPALYHPRFELLDAWRGLAALAVVVHHVFNAKASGNPLDVPIGAPAVILFFVISGYCITASTEACMARGMGFRQFIWRRIRRIYFPFLLSVGFWAATRALKWKMTGANELDRPWTDWLQNLTLTQWVSLIWNPYSDAMHNPVLFVPVYWSLCYEEQFYVLMGLFVGVVLWLRRRSLARDPLTARPQKYTLPMVIFPLMAAALAWNVAFPSISYGVFIEFWAMFCMGVVVYYRLCRVKSRTARRAIDAGLVVFAAACAFVRWFAGIEWEGGNVPGLIRSVYDELFISSAFALVLIAMRPADQWFRSSMVGLPLRPLGKITFSLYLVHMFNMNLVYGAADKALSFLPFEAPTALRVLTVIGGHIALATVFWWVCERPFLNKSLHGLPAPGSVSGMAARGPAGG